MKRYLISSGITFVTAFVISFGGQLATNPVTASTFGVGVLVSLGTVALRAAFKALGEYMSSPTPPATPVDTTQG